MTLTDFRRKKLIYVFQIFFDLDSSGAIDRKDFDLSVEKITQNQGLKQGDARYTDLRDKLLDLWAGLTELADDDGNEEVSQEEWFDVWQKYTETDKSTDWFDNYKNFVFDLQDSSGDGSIGEDEFVVVWEGFGHSLTECKTAFEKVSSNNSITIDREEFGKLWHEFFTSEDPEARGNFIFGKINFNQMLN